MNVQEIRDMTDDDLEDAILDKREEIFNLRFQKEAGQMEDTNALRYAKRDLAQLLTVQHQRALAAQIAQAQEDA